MDEVIHPDDIGLSKRIIRLWRRGEPQSDEYRIKHKDGSWGRWVETSITPTLDEAENLFA